MGINCLTKERIPDIDPVLFKFADNSNTAISEWKNDASRADLMGKFLSWTQENNMNCNPERCKELILRKKKVNQVILPAYNIPQCTSAVILGMIF